MKPTDDIPKLSASMALTLVAYDPRSSYSDLFRVLDLGGITKEMVDQLPKDYQDIVLTLMKDFVEAESYMSTLTVVERYSQDYNTKADDYTDACSGEILQSHYDMYWDNIEIIKTLYNELV